jgi:superfamily II RNA helicase
MVIEQLMVEGLIDAVFATSTVAAGVNFPARTVAFLNSDRFNGKEFLPMSPTEFHQMTGRAGRRGMDHIGFAMAIPGKFMDIRLIAKLITSNPSEVMSQVRINFSMVLNLLLSHTPDQVENLLKKSFAAFQFTLRTKNIDPKKNSKHSNRRLLNDFQRHLKFLNLSGFVTERGQLTDDGVWASNLRVDQPLLIAQGFRQHLFSQLEPDLLAAIISVFVYDGELEGKPDQTSIPKKLSVAFQQTTRQLHPFVKQMAGHGFKTHSFLFMPAHTIFMWATGQSWDHVLEQTPMAEGDLAMLIFRTVDNLRHIVGLKDVFPESAETAKVAISLLMRDPVIFDDVSLE